MSDTNAVRICLRCGEVLPFSDGATRYQVSFGVWRQAEMDRCAGNTRGETCEVCKDCYGTIRKTFTGPRKFTERLFGSP